MSNNFRLNAKKPRNNAGVATPKCEMFLLYREDIVSIPPAGARGILTEGDIKIKSGRRFHILYTTPTTQVHSRDTEGEVDSRGWKKKITGHHPGDELEINEFVKNNVNQGFVIVVKSCQSEYMKIYGSVNNPMYFTGSFVDDSEKKGYELTFEQNFADEDPILFYQGNIIVDEDALAEIDPEFSSLFVKLDASNIDEESKNLLKKKLDIGELPKNVATVDEGEGEDKKEGTTYTKDQVDDLLDEKLATPTEEGTTTTHPYVVGVDAAGNSVKLPAGDLDKNIGNTNLETTDNRTFTQKHIYTHATGGFPYRITGLADKSVDTAFNGILVRNANGDLAVTTNSALLVNGMKAMNDTQKDQWRASLLKANEKYSTGQPRVDVLLPPIIDLSSSSSSSILVLGINLFINNVDKVSSIDIIKVSNNEVVETIQNVMVHQTMPTQLTFDINKSLYAPDEDYTIQITHNGVKSILNKNATFRVVSQIVQNEVDMQWKLINHSRTIGSNGSVDFSSDAKSFTISQPAGSRLIESGIVNVVSKKEFDFNKGYMFFISFRAGLPSQHAWTWFGNIWMSFIAKENVNENTNAFYGTDATAIIGQAYNNAMRLAGFSDDRGVGGSGENIATSGGVSYSFIMMVKGGIVKFIYGNRVFIKRLTPTSSNLYTLIGSFFRRYNNVTHSLYFSVDNIVEF